MLQLISAKEAKQIATKYKENSKFLEVVSKNIEKAAKKGLSFIDVEVSSLEDEFYNLVKESFSDFTIDKIKEFEIDDDPYSGKTYKYLFRIWW